MSLVCFEQTGRCAIFGRKRPLNRNIRRYGILCSLSLLSAVSLPASCEEFSPTLSFKGFGTVGISGSDTERLGFRRDISQNQGVTNNAGFDIDSRLGLQLDAELNPYWHLGAQWVARSHAGDFIEQNLDWAFLRWSPSLDTDIRVGRLGIDQFLLSDYRNVGYAYLWIRPPHEFYAGLPVYHFDGADISKKIEIGATFLTVKGFGGYTAYDAPSVVSGTESLGSVVVGFSALLEYENWKARLAYNWTRNVQDPKSLGQLSQALNDPSVAALWPDTQSLIDALRVEDTTIQFSSIGLAYDDGVWLMQFEGSYIDSDYSGYPSLASGYLSGGRRFGKLTLYSLFGIAETLHKHYEVSQPLLAVPQLVALRDGVERSLNQNGVDEKSVSLGLRYEVYENVALKAQWSHFWLGENGTQFWIEPQNGATPDTVNVWSFGLDFIF